MTKRDLTSKRFCEIGSERDWREERYSVEVEFHHDEILSINGLLETWRNEEGEIHRNFGPAMVHIASDTEKIVYQAWYQNGLLHRDNGPALIHYDPTTDMVFKEEYYRNGNQYIPDQTETVDPSP